MRVKLYLPSATWRGARVDRLGGLTVRVPLRELRRALEAHDEAHQEEEEGAPFEIAPVNGPWSSSELDASGPALLEDDTAAELVGDDLTAAELEDAADALEPSPREI